MNIPKIVYTRLHNVGTFRQAMGQRAMHLWGYKQYITHKENCQAKLQCSEEQATTRVRPYYIIELLNETLCIVGAHPCGRLLF